MPYESTKQLPESVKNVLPKHAQDVYQEAYNNALEQYSDPKKRRDDADLEETASRVAWSAVKKAGYEKGDDDNWHKT